MDLFLFSFRMGTRTLRFRALRGNTVLSGRNDDGEQQEQPGMNARADHGASWTKAKRRVPRRRAATADGQQPLLTNIVAASTNDRQGKCGIDMVNQRSA